MGSTTLRLRSGATAALITITIMLAGCTSDTHTVAGFVLPSGDIERGKTAMVDLGCRQCHVVAAVELPAYAGPMRFHIELGGKVLKVKTYGDLLTSVVNPNHDLAEQFTATLKSAEKTQIESPMPDFNSTMSVQQLIDIVEFLHARYSLLVPEYQGIVYGI